MLTTTLFKAILLALSCSLVHASPAADAVKTSAVASAASNKKKAESERVQVPAATRVAAPVVPTISTKIDNVVVKLNTSSTHVEVKNLSEGVAATTIAGTVLILARDAASSYSAFSGLNSYGIPYQVVLVPQEGLTALPVLNSSATVGNYGAIVVMSEVSYSYSSTNFSSALTTDQWATLYQYQVSFAVRMVRLDVYPGPAFGAAAVDGGCCDDGVEQLISISNTTAFPNAGVATGAGVSTLGLWHYPANITDPTIAVEFAQFGPSGTLTTSTTAGVINTISGRQQMVFFTGFATDWSASSNFLMHPWITWVTRGLYTGYRRINLNTQVDDMFLTTDLFTPVGGEFEITTDDLDEYLTWMPQVTAKLPPGSEYFIEICHNGNGNIEDAVYTYNAPGDTCGDGPIEYADQIDTALEFMKPIGTGTDIWPENSTTYPYTLECNNYGKLKLWWSQISNRDAFAHISHTFTHEDQDNSTYFDVTREISWNIDWLKQVNLSSAARFSPQGLVPPGITGLHNGDALRAWKENGIIYVVGDNTRPVLLNTQNEHWPLMSTVESNGYEGIQINPRWASNIYYNCASPDCCVAEWQNTSAGVGDWDTVLGIEKNTNVRHLLGLHHDPYMFHQANLNYVTGSTYTVDGVTAKLSLLQVWVETMITEIIRLVNWPVVSLKHDDMAESFLNRMQRDQCNATLTYTTDPTAQTITGVTLTSTGNTCITKIPVTVPGSVTDTQGFTTEQLGNDPLTIWVQLAGSPVTFTLKTPVPFY